MTSVRELVRAGANGPPPEVGRTLLAEPPPLYDFEQMLEQPALAWLIQSWLAVAGFVTLTGRWGTGKSFLALAWAMAVGLNRPWLRHAVRGGGALYVAAEGLRAERLEAYRTRWGVEQLPAVWWRKQALPLASPAAVDTILRQIKGLPVCPKLIVLDTVPRCSAGLKENDASDAGILVESIGRLIRETGATVVGVNHPPHGAPDRSRGSSALDAGADACLLLERRDAGLVLRATKMKDGSTPDPLPLRLVCCGSSAVMELDDGSSHDTTPAEATALAALRRIGLPGGVSAKEWRIATELPERTFYDARGRLVQRGTVKKDKTKYRIPDTATAEALQ